MLLRHLPEKLSKLSRIQLIRFVNVKSFKCFVQNALVLLAHRPNNINIIYPLEVVSFFK